MSKNVRDNALLLQAIAGYDDIDDRQLGAPRFDNVPDYVDILDQCKTSELPGLRIGILREAFEMKLVAPKVRKLVLAACDKLKDLGATVEDVSIPL